MKSLHTEIRRSLLTSIVASSIGQVWVVVALGVATTMLLVRMGATGFQLGLAVAVQQVAVMAQLVGATVGERLTRRRRFWAVTALIHRLIWLAPVALILMPGLDDAQRVRWLIAAIAVSAALGHVSTPIWFSWMADLVPQRISGRFWGFRQTITMASFVLMAWLAGRMLDAYTPGGSMRGFVIVFFVGVLGGCLDILLHCLVHEPTPHPQDHGSPFLTRVREIWSCRDYRWLTLSMGVWLFTLGMVGQYGMVYLRHELNVTYSELTYLSVAGSLGALVAGIPMGRLIDRVGARSIGALLMAVAPVQGAIVWFFIHDGTVILTVPWLGQVSVPFYMALLAPSSFVAGALYSGVGLSQIHLINAVSPRNSRVVAMAVHWSTIGSMAALGPLLGGWVMDLLAQHPLRVTLPSGQPIAFYHVLLIAQSALAAGLASPLLLRVSERGKGFPPGLTPSFMRFGNPLRLFSILCSWTPPDERTGVEFDDEKEGPPRR